MAVEEMKRLARKLLGSPLAEDGQVSLSHDDYTEHMEVLPDNVRANVEKLMEDLKSVIPNDFSFDVFFNLEGARIGVDFEDGNTGCSAFAGSFMTRKSIMNRLRHVPWDEVRADAINQSSMFDQMLSAADDRPADIPSSEAAAMNYEPALREEIASVQQSNPLPEFALIIGRDDLGISCEHLNTRDDVIGTIADRMTTLNDILAVLEKGEPWTYAAIEAAKLEAVDGLGPISRAKAERRYF